MPLPSAFCWSKFGVEAGEDVASILSRKERERQASGGTFLWGIGNSIRPSLVELLTIESTPTVVFTPMRAAPAKKDREPDWVISWQAACCIEGDPFELPTESCVTSSANGRRKHYALVCRREQPLFERDGETWVDEKRLRNLRSGGVVGSSQVTSVVRVVDDRPPSERYRVAFSATLEAPYLVVLEDPIPLRDGELNGDLGAGRHSRPGNYE